MKFDCVGPQFVKIFYCLAARWLNFEPFFCILKINLSALRRGLARVVATPIRTLNFRLINVRFVHNHASALHVCVSDRSNVGISSYTSIDRRMDTILSIRSPVAITCGLRISSPNLSHPLFATRRCTHFIKRRIALILHVTMRGHHG